MSRKSNRPVAKPRRPATAPKQPSKGEQLQKLAEGSFKWTRRNAWIALAGVVVAVAAIVVPIVVAAITHDDPSPGLAVNVVPGDVIGGAAIYPAPGVRPNAYLGNGESLYVDCLQPVKPNYMLVHISAGPYLNHWVDMFDVKTPRGEDLRVLNPLLPKCGPPVGRPPTASTS